MNWTDPSFLAGYILVGGSGVLTMIIRARKMWIRDARDIQYDEGQTQWVKDLQAEVSILRKEKEQLWKEKIEDIRVIEQLRASDAFLKREVERMRDSVALLEGSIGTLKMKLASIDSTIGPTK